MSWNILLKSVDNALVVHSWFWIFLSHCELAAEFYQKQYIPSPCVPVTNGLMNSAIYVQVFSCLAMGSHAKPGVRKGTRVLEIGGMG